jgi:hydrophobe/amphiphile efflux-1 (HAE1) family protein
MNLILLSIRRPVFAWMLMSGLIIFGAISANRLGVSQLPDIDFPVLTINVTYEGASPEVVENELIEPIEERLLEIEGLKQMRSTVRLGSGTIVLDFNIDRNVDVALQEVQGAISQLRLPFGIDPPVIKKTNPEDQPFIFLGVSSNKPIQEVLNWVDSFLLDQFRFIPGIGEASIAGFPVRNIRIWPDIKKLKNYELTVSDIITGLQTQHLESAAGQMVEDKQELRVRWLGEANTPKEIADIRLLRRGAEAISTGVNPDIYIRDVAKVEDGLSDVRRMVRLNGVEGVGIGLKKQRGINEVQLAEAVYKKVESLQKILPEGYKVVVHIDMTRSTKAVVETTYEKLLVASLVTILVCFLFLGSWQAAINILFSIPTSLIGTFIVVYFSGFTLNLFSLLALTLAVSIVVDDAIMLLENIVRHYRMGKSGAQAAYDGSTEILPAATAATLAVMAVFLPVVFMEGVIGKFFFQFGVTMSSAVLLSLIEAVTITPMRAATLMASQEKKGEKLKIGKIEHWLEERFEKINAFYARVLAYTLKYSKTVVSISIFLFCASLLLVKQVRREFVPLQDQDLIIVIGQAPTGSSFDFTLKKSIEVEERLKKYPEIQNIYNSIGSGGATAEINQFSMPIKLVPRETRKLTHVELMDRLRKELKDIPDVKISLRDFSSRGLTSGRQFPLSINIIGPELEVLREKSQVLINRLNEEGLTQDLDTDFKQGMPELLIRPNRQAMAARGVTIQSVASVLEATVAGIRQGQFTSAGKRYDIRIKLPEMKVTSPKDIEKILVRNIYGNTIPLSELVTFESSNTYQAITRVNRQRAVGIFGNIKTGKSQSSVLERAQEIAKEILPPGYIASLEGASAGLTESFGNLTFALMLGILVAYMILGVQFNSFIHPISILIALPFSITGALLVLWASGASLNLFSFIGIIVLMGISKKNSILLVEFTNHVRGNAVLTREGIKNALIEACPVRLRPILMTSAATIAAATPLIIGNSMGQETRTPMGLTIVGGTLVSTVLTLFVVPCLYLILSRFESKDRLDSNLKIEKSV